MTAPTPTPETLAAKIASRRAIPAAQDMLAHEIAKAIRTYADARVAEMQERCATIADAYGGFADRDSPFARGGQRGAETIARTIRALPKTEGGGT